MSQNVSHHKISFRPAPGQGRQRVKDSVLLAIVFLIGLIGTCYILHFALSNNGRSGYYLDEGSHPAERSETIYFTAND